VSLAEVIDAGARRRQPRSRRGWLACTPTLARVGLARGQSMRGGALAPPCASHGDTSRHAALPGLPLAGRRRCAVTLYREVH